MSYKTKLVIMGPHSELGMGKFGPKLITSASSPPNEKMDVMNDGSPNKAHVNTIIDSY